MYMKTKNHIGIYILLAVLFILGYVFLAAKPLGKEYHFTPEWKKSISVPPAETVPSNTQLIDFKLGRSIGYFTADGLITTSKSYPAKASVSSSYYAIYNTEDKEIPIYGKDNQEKGKFSVPGYPFFEDDRIFVFMPGGASFAKCTEDGSVSWINENTVPLTAFSSKSKYTAAGYADGTIRLIDNDTGIEKSNFAPGGSDYKVIFGLDISSDGSYIASLSGHNKLRFVLTKNDGNQPKIIYHKYLDSDLNTRTVIRFCDNDSHIIYNYNGYLGIYNIAKEKDTQIKIDKEVLSIHETDTLFFVLGKKDKEYTVYIIEKTDTLEGSFSFTADAAFIKASGNSLYVGQDNFISKLKVSKK